MEAYRAKVTHLRPYNLQVGESGFEFMPAWPQRFGTESSAESWGLAVLAGTGTRVPESELGLRGPLPWPATHPRTRLAAGIHSVACLPADSTSCEMDSYPEYVLSPPATPHTGPGDTAVATTGVPTSLPWWGREPRGRGWAAFRWLCCGCLPSWVGPKPRVMWPNLLPDGESRPPARGVHKTPWPWGGSVRLTKEVLSWTDPSLKLRDTGSVVQSLLEAGHSQSPRAKARGWHRASPPAQKLTALLFLPSSPVSLPSQVWFWFFSHSYLFIKENSAVLRGKNLPQHKNMPHFHLMLSIFFLSFF